MNVRQVGYVPDSGHARLIHLVRADRSMRAIPLTTEEEGVALAAGAWLGGERSVLLMQSSGAGNCINMLGMANELRVPLLALVTMRGQWGEFNPWQVPMGQSTAAALETAGASMESRSLSHGILQAAQRVREGSALARSLEQVPAFPELAIEMIAVGESTGSVVPMLNSVAEFYEEDVQTALAAAMSLIEPVLLIFMGLVVGFVLISLYLPIFTLGAGGVGR